MWSIYLWIKEAFRGIFRNFTINFFATSLSLISFFVLGFWLIIGVNVTFISNNVEESVGITINLDDEITQYEQTASDISELQNVKEIQFISKEEAYQEMERNLGDRKGMLTELGFNPFPASFNVQVHNPELIKNTVKEIESLGIAKSVKYGENYIEQLFEITEKLEVIILVLLIVMMVSSGSLVYVSIRMNILNRNKELEIKDLIGAGKINIRLPFIIEGTLLTFISAAVVIVSIYFGYEFANIYITEKYPGTLLAPVEDVLETVIPILLTISLLVGAFSSFLSTQKYLKRH